VLEEQDGSVTISSASSQPSRTVVKVSNRAQRRRQRREQTAGEPIRRTVVAASNPPISTGRWWAIAHLVGPALPDRSHHIDPSRDDVHSIEVRPMTDAEYAHALKHRHAPPGIEGIRHGFLVDSPRVDVFSRYIVRWVFDAHGAKAAHDKAADELVPELEAVLGLLDQDRYRIDFVRYGPIALAGRRTAKGAWKYSPVFSMPPYTLFEAKHATAIATNLRVVASSPTAQHSVALLAAGDRANDFRLNEPSLAVAALNQYHLAVEAVVRSCGANRSDIDDEVRNDARAAVIDKLQSSLADASELTESVRAVNRATDELRALNESSYRARAARAIAALSLPDAALDELLAFYNFRNRFLGHPEEMLDNTTAASWVTRARDVAWTVVAAFVQHLGGQLVDVPRDRSLPPDAKGRIVSRMGHSSGPKPRRETR
jgi:hypothetical protein